jgi:glucose-1-phosphate cytidylyltransferase
MKTYAYHGFREFVLCLGYRGNVIKDYFLNYEAMNNDFTICLGKKFHVHYNGNHQEQDFQVTLADTGLETNTCGRVKRASQYVDGGTFMLTYGDGVADIDIPRVLEFHKSHAAWPLSPPFRRSPVSASWTSSRTAKS